MEAPQILLAHHLKTLKLPTFLREYEKQARPRRRPPPEPKVCAPPRAGRYRRAGSRPVPGAPGGNGDARRRAPPILESRAFGAIANGEWSSGASRRRSSRPPRASTASTSRRWIERRENVIALMTALSHNSDALARERRRTRLIRLPTPSGASSRPFVAGVRSFDFPATLLARAGSSLV